MREGDTVKPMSASKPLYSLLVLENLQDLAGSKEAMASMLRTIESTLGEDITQLKNQVAAQQMQAVGEKLHALKGYIPMMCKPGLTDRLVATEALAQGQTNPSLCASEEMMALLKAFDILYKEIQEALNNTA